MSKDKISLEALDNKAETGDLEAQRSLALLHELGLASSQSAKPDWKQAKKYWGLAAQQKDPMAIRTMVESARTGNSETPPDPEGYAYWQGQAKAIGLEDPLEKLARLKKEQRTITTATKGRTVLVVERSLDERKAIRAALESIHYNIIETGNSLDVFTILNGDRSISSVFADIQLPGSKPFELIEKLRRLYPTMEIVAISSNAAIADHIEKAKQLKLKAWLVRPIKPEILVTKASKFLKAAI